MSIPINHHYVSQCHQKEFFNNATGRIYVYDKELNNHYNRQSPKNLFSKNHLNTRETKGIIDQVTLETELKVLFEDQFHDHVNVVKKFLISQEEMQTTYESLCWLTMLGILGEIRHPDFKGVIEDMVLKMESDLINRFYGGDKNKIFESLKAKQKTPYSNALSYIELAVKRLEKLEPLDFFIVSIESNDHFLLPDTSCFQLRGQLRSYPNPMIHEIIQVGVPLTGKLYILATPQLFKSELHGIKFEKTDNSSLVYEINKDLYHFAKKAVACSDETFLKNFINKLKDGT
jgi:hypothetical protein